MQTLARWVGHLVGLLWELKASSLRDTVTPNSACSRLKGEEAVVCGTHFDHWLGWALKVIQLLPATAKSSLDRNTLFMYSGCRAGW